MKFPYIPIMQVVEEAVDEVKKLDKTTSFTKNQYYTWAISCVREIGFNAWEDFSTEVEIKKHNGELPEGFYLITDMWRCSPNPEYSIEPVSPNPHRGELRWIRTEIMRPLDGETNRYYNKLGRVNPKLQNALNTYQIKNPPGIIRTSFKDGFISMDYTRLPMENGMVLMQDEENAIRAVKWFIKYMMLHESWLLGQVRQDVYLSLQREYDDYLVLAQGVQKAPDPSHTRFEAIRQDQRYRNMRYLYQ